MNQSWCAGLATEFSFSLRPRSFWARRQMVGSFLTLEPSEVSHSRLRFACLVGVSSSRSGGMCSSRIMLWILWPVMTLAMSVLGVSVSFTSKRAELSPSARDWRDFERLRNRPSVFDELQRLRTSLSLL